LKKTHPFFIRFSDRALRLVRFHTQHGTGIIGGATPKFLGGPNHSTYTLQHWNWGSNRNHCVMCVKFN